MSAASRVPASFRDPSGFLFWRDGVLFRQVNPVYADVYERLEASGFWKAAIDAGQLIPHSEVDAPAAAEPAYRILRPELLSFVSYPYEWSFSQLKDAALLTLALQKRALESGFSLKDASAYNVQFRAGRPILIDSLSFEPYREGEPWVAYQQFCRHFFAPLALVAYRHADLQRLLRVHIDGVPLDLASMLLPARTRLRPALAVHVHLHARMQRRHGSRTDAAARTRTGAVSRNALLGLVDGLTAATRRLELPRERTAWSEYYDETNYTEAATQAKLDFVRRGVAEMEPHSVWDLGANVGRFSRIASEGGIPTLAIDADPSVVDRCYREARERGDGALLPLVMDLTNPSPGLGWHGTERASLLARGPADLALALALVHHLAIGNNVPLVRVAQLLRDLGRALIVEFVPKGDSQVERLLATRPDIFPDYTREGFESAFSSVFTIRNSEPIPESKRVIYLMEARETS